MNPDNDRPTTPNIPSRGSAASSPHVPPRHPQQRDAAADLVRGQINHILDQHDPVGDNATLEQASTEVARQQQTPAHVQQSAPAAAEDAANPYLRTHSQTSANSADGDDQWKKYHSSWQRYYQEYYSRYYVGELYKSQTELMKRAEERAAASRPADEGMTQTEAMNDLRSQLRNNITKGAKKVRGSRHFIPIMAGVVVMLVFVFLQYNSLIFATVAAYTSPGNIAPANVIVNPNENLEVPPSQDNRLIIPKLNIDVPVDFNAKPDNDSQMAAMNSGVAYFGIPGADAKPGQIGNFGIAGHSSNQWYDTGAYKFIFVNLSELTKGDSIYVNYGGTRYTYTVTKSQVVNPDQISALQDNAQKPEVTLITCTPAGTALQRLLVTAEQVAPDPSSAKKGDSQTTSTSGAAMPGNSPTVFEKLFSR